MFTQRQNSVAGYCLRKLDEERDANDFQNIHLVCYCYIFFVINGNSFSTRQQELALCNFKKRSNE